jgi:hypothetical protein
LSLNSPKLKRYSGYEHSSIGWLNPAFFTFAALTCPVDLRAAVIEMTLPRYFSVVIPVFSTLSVLFTQLPFWQGNTHGDTHSISISKK